MEEYQTEISRIKDLLAGHTDGMSITDIAGMLQVNRNTVSKYMDILQIQGAVDGRKIGTSKVYYLSERLPVSSLRKVCSRPFFVVNPDGIVVDLNPGFCSLVNISADQIIQQSYERLPLQILEGTSAQNIFKAVMRGMEQRIRAAIHQGDKRLPVDLVMIPVVFESGKPGAAVLIDRDENPGEKQTGETASSDIMALLDDQMEYVVRQTAEGITRYANETYSRAVGKSREELVGRPFKPLVSPEDADRIRAHLKSLTVQYPVGTIEYRAVMANGELRYQRWQDRGRFNGRGELVAIDSCGIDITDFVTATRKLRKTQETLEESIVSRTEELRGINRHLYAEIAQRENMEEQLLLTQFAMDNATDMIFWIDKDARIKYANTLASEMLQYDPNDILQQSFGDIVPAYSLGSWDTLWQDLKTGGGLSRETALVKRDGARLPAEVKLSYLEYRGKQFINCIGRDLSEHTRMERALQESNKKLNVFSSIARHDIQNKITVLLGYLGRTRKAVSDPLLLEYLDRQEQAAKAIRTEINLTRDFKDLGAEPPVWQNVRSVIELAARPYAGSSLAIATDLPDVEIYADVQLDHVFDRLFEFALGTGEKPVQVRISSVRGDRNFRVLVEDNGTGIPAEEKDQLFELKGDGTGRRGLFIAREILSITGITLEESGESGSGSRFELGTPEAYYRYPSPAR
jgi:PAS domain S-box-containing protein